MSNLDKKVLLNLENTANYTDRHDLSVAFSTADRDSAVFNFNVTKGNKPMILTEQNVRGHIALKHSDGSFVKDTLQFNNDINSQFTYQVPNELLKRDGSITMQILIAELGNSDTTVAERIVNFKVENSLFSQINADTKMQYIVEYDELATLLEERVQMINDKIANAEDYVKQVENARDKGLSDIEIARKTSVDQINSLASAKLNDLETKGSTYSKRFDDNLADMDAKKQAFDTSVSGSGLVTTGQSANWQKAKITNDDGSRQYLKQGTIKDITGLAPGSYETVTDATPTAQGFPSNLVSTYVEIDVTVSSLDVKRKRIELTSTYNGTVFYRIFHTNGDRDTGWLQVPLVTNMSSMETPTGAQAKANTAESNANIYTNDQITSLKTVLFNGSANGINTTIDLADDYNKYTLLVVYGELLGTDIVVPANPQSTRSIFLAANNVSDADGNGAQMYEARLEKTTTKRLTIKNDVFYDVKNDVGSGANANKITITKIVGWK